MKPQASSHWSVGELRFATLPSVPTSLLREISEAFQLRLPAGSDESPLAYPLLLRSADDSWAVRLVPSALALETRADEPYDFLVQRLPEIARIALPYLDTDFFTRTAIRTIRSLPIWEAMDGTRAIAEEAYKFNMVMTSTKAGSSRAGHFIIQETVGPSRGHFTRDLGIYEEAVGASRLESVLKKLVQEFYRIMHGPDQRWGPSYLDKLQTDLSKLTPWTSWEFQQLPGTLVFLPAVISCDVDLTGSDLDSEVEQLNEDRIRLLARKYVGTSFSREDEARLEILQERILHLLPSVQKHDFERLEELAAVTRGVHERHLERMNRLGLAK